MGFEILHILVCVIICTCIHMFLHSKHSDQLTKKEIKALRNLIKYNEKNEKKMINLVHYDIMYVFDTLYHGWECDMYGYIGRHKETGDMQIILTDHGLHYIANIDNLHNLIETYEKTITATKKAIEIMATK